MTARERGRIAIVLLALVGGCQKSAPPATATAADATAPGDDLADAEQRLAGNAARMRALGITLGEASRDRNRAVERETNEPPEKGKPVGEKDDAMGSSSPRPDMPGAKSKSEPTPAPPPQSPQPIEETKPVTPPKASEQGGGEADRCTQICELADVACGLEQQVCELAEYHVGEARYEDACWRARDQCERGRDACDECSAAC